VHLEQLHTGCRWAEGPVYFPAGRYLLWSDIPNDRVMRWDENDGSVSVFEQPAWHPNGHTRDLQGRLVSCEHRGRRVSRTEHDGSRTVLASHHEGRRLNSPNDVVVKSDGSVWFTDPTYGIDSDYEGDAAPSEIGGSHVYRIDPDDGRLDAVVTDMSKPNGLAFSPDEQWLYVVDTGISHAPDGPRHIRRHRVQADGRRVGRGEACSTACEWMSTATSGPAPATGCTASRPTARSSARSACPRSSPMSASAAPSATGCSSVPRVLCTRST
jgi:gluconolactonase